MVCNSSLWSLTRFAFLLLFGWSSTALATGYGVFDPRSMGMAGAAVAAGNAEQAHAYNAALLSFYDEDENYSKNGRIVHPFVSAQVSDAGKSTVDLVSDELADAVSDAIALFNGNTLDPDLQNAVVASLDDLLVALEELNREVIELDTYTGLVISEPSEREGGSFYFHARGMVFGQANVTDEDINTLNTLADSVTTGVPLVDPVPALTSEGDITSLLIAEWGLAMAKEFPIFGQPISFGITPKIAQVEVYTESLNFVDDIPTYSENSKRHLFMNADVGVAAEFLENYRVGFSVRNILSKTLDSENGLVVELKPRPRLGFAYINDFMTIGLDADVQKSEPLANEPDSQELALGVEFHPWETIALRLGYMQDSAGEKDDLISAGVRYQVLRVALEAGFALSDDVTGASLLMGWRF